MTNLESFYKIPSNNKVISPISIKDIQPPPKIKCICGGLFHTYTEYSRHLKVCRMNKIRGDR